MAAIYDQLTSEQQEFLRDYIRRVVKQDILTTGDVDVSTDDPDIRILTDVHAAFITNGVEAGDSVEFYDTNPDSISPPGSFLVTSVDDENTIQFIGDAAPLGIHTKYRIVNTSPIQQLINDEYRTLASTLNVDKVEALRLEAINVPWYNRTTSIVFQYFAERTALDGYRFFYPVTQFNLDEVTLIPRPTPALLTGPLLYPYQYSATTPDRRPGDPVAGLGTPALIGAVDTAPPAIPSYDYGTNSGSGIPLDAGEYPALLEEDAFYSGTASQFPSPPGYQGDDVSRLESIRDAQEDSLNREIAAIDVLIPLIDEELDDLRERGVTGTGLHASLSLARLRLTNARANAVHALTDPDDGIPAITTGGQPTVDRLNFIQNVRPAQIVARLSEILQDQAFWVQMRYVMLNRRVNPVNGSLTLLRLADARAAELLENIATLKEERLTINYPIGVNGG